MNNTGKDEKEAKLFEAAFRGYKAFIGGKYSNMFKVWLYFRNQNKRKRNLPAPHHYWRIESASGMLMVITPAEYELWGKDNQPRDAYQPAYTFGESTNEKD